MDKLIDISSYPVANVLEILLQDKTTKQNIIWATDTYEELGEGFSDKVQMNAFSLLQRPEIIRPRIQKTLDEQAQRTRKKAEVFTPAWLCNKMNNHCDEEWFGRANVFNCENSDNSWTIAEGRIEFPKRKTWKHYVDSRRLEITCGEAPYLVSRYDVSTGELIVPPKNRIGMLDRKLRIVNENTNTHDEWLKWAQRAFEAVYGYEYQGDNLLIARINLLLSFEDYYEERWERKPDDKVLRKIANIIARNIWQMDGLKAAVPLGKPYEEFEQLTLLGTSDDCLPEQKPCEIYDWRSKVSLKFSDLKEMQTMGKKLFSYVIGNPPYQEDDGGAQASAKPIYQYFVNSAKEITEVGFSLIMPARWYAGGKGLDEFRDCMINDKHIKSLHDYPMTDDIFPNVNIRGGVCIVLWCNNHNADRDNTTVFTHIGNAVTKKERRLKSDGVNIFIRYSQAVEILEKVQKAQKENSLMPHVSPRKPFGLSSNFPKESGFHSDKNDLKEPVTCYSKGKNIGYVEFSEILSHREWVDKWKVFVPRANNIGTELNDDNLNSFVGQPNFICTESYIVIGGDLNLTQLSSQNLKNYMQTKFVRFMHSLAKSSQDATAKTYMFVPLQDFTENSDIDWSKSVAVIDRQLYKKYGLTPEEIDFIETHVKEMS